MKLVEAFAKKFEERGGRVLKEFAEVFDIEKDIRNYACDTRIRKKEIREILESKGLKEVDFESADFTITRADAAVAKTGSLVFAYKSGKNFMLSSLPRVQLVLLREKNIYADLVEAVSRFTDYPYVSLVTGPSVTGDIELMHVRGVHGPEKLYLVFEK